MWPRVWRAGWKGPEHGGWVGSEAGLRRSLRRISLVDNTRRCVAALHGYGSPLCPRGGKLHRRCTHDMRGWEPGRQEWLPPGYRIDTTDAAIGVLRRSDDTVEIGRASCRERV